MLNVKKLILAPLNDLLPLLFIHINDSAKNVHQCEHFSNLLSLVQKCVRIFKTEQDFNVIFSIAPIKFKTLKILLKSRYFGLEGFGKVLYLEEAINKKIR